MAAHANGRPPFLLIALLLAACSNGSDPRTHAQADAAAGSRQHAGGSAADAHDGASALDGGGDAGDGGSAALDAGSAQCVDVALEPPAFSDERALHPVPLDQHQFFRIAVIASDSQAPLAGAQLETVNHIVAQSDVHGVIAFYEPGLMGHEVYFDVRYPGYERPADGFGYHGVRLQVMEGGAATVELDPVASATPPMVTSDLQSRLAAGPVPGPEQCYALALIDRATGRGVPLVRVALGDDVLWSDSNGLVAYCNPDRVGQSLQVQVSSHGYEPASASLSTSAGGEGTIMLDRINIAERLYRATGEGIYRDSTLLGRDVPLEQPVLDGQVMGQDTVQTAIYQGEVFWVWGDTQRPSYPLGNFHTSSARSELPEQGGLPPSGGVDFDYFVGTDGFSKAMAPPESVPGEGVTWLGSLIAVPDQSGQEQLFARYALVPSDLTADEVGLVRFDDARALFVKELAFPSTTSRGPDGHPTRWLQPGGDYVYYQPPLRIPATAEAMLDPARYEVFTAFAQGTESLERGPDGTLAYGWKTDTGYVTTAALDAAGTDHDQALDGHLRDPEGDESITAHGASSRTWNAYRQRFSELVQQVGGSSSYLGEIWYSEGDTPLGPWVYSRKVVTHDDYTFYNPRQHPFFDQQDGRLIYFEGTYVTTFASNAAVPTPRYDYNQVMYRLDLDDPRLVLPVAVYERPRLGDTPELVTKAGVRMGDPPLLPVFFAPDRAAEGLIALSWSGAACMPSRSLVASAPGASALPAELYALSPDTEPNARPEGSRALYAFTAANGAVTYALEGAGPDGAERAAMPLAYVWPSPLRVRLPVADYLGELVAFAGEDQCASTSAAGYAIIALDGSGSNDLRGAITRYLWTAASALGCTQVEGERAELELAPGTHVVYLDVWDEAGNHDRDSLLIDVAR